MSACKRVSGEWKKIIPFMIVSILALSMLGYDCFNVGSVKNKESDVLQTSVDWCWETDTVCPEAMLLSGPNGVINYNTVIFIWIGKDDTTCEENLLYAYRLKGETDEWSSWIKDTSKTYSNLPNGEYTFQVKAKDEAGNIDITPVEGEFIVDFEEKKPDDKIYEINWLIMEEEYPTESPIFVSKHRPHTEIIRIPKDNIKSVSFELTWKDDHTALFSYFGKDTLTFSIKAPNGTKIFYETSIGNGKIKYTANDINAKLPSEEIKGKNESDVLTKLTKYYSTNWKNESIKIVFDLKLGEKGIIRRLLDKGNDFDLSISYRYYKLELEDMEDNSPDTKILTGPSGTIDYNDVTFIWIGSDDITSTGSLKYSYKLVGKDLSWSNWVSSISKTYSNLPNGEYTFQVKAKDGAGNIDLTSAQVSFTVETGGGDTTLPNTIINSGPTGTINYDDVTFTWAGNDDITSTGNLKYSYKLEGKDPIWSGWTSSTSKTYNNLADKSYTFKVKAKDEAGNIDATPATRSFTVEVGGTEPNRFATSVIELNFGANHHTSYADSNKALGGPRGLGNVMGSIHVLSLGRNGDITLGFDITITNGPGKDFIVFENSFYINDLPGKVYAELMYVEVSTDGANFARFPSISNTSNPGSIYPNDVINLAGVWPVYANVDTNNIDPFNANVAGGDAFDLQSLNSNPLVQSGLVDLQNINYVRLIDILGDGSNLDSQGNPIYDPIDLDNGADLDAVAVINYT